MKRQLKKHIYTILCICIAITSYGQGTLSYTDSLVNEYLKSTSDSVTYNIGLQLMETNSKLTIDEARGLYRSYAESANGLKIILANGILADVFFYKNQLDSSLYYYFNQATLAESGGMLDNAISGYGNAAYVLSDLGYIESALELIKEKLSLAKIHGDSRNVADYFYNLSSYYADLNQLDSSLYYIQKCLDLDIENNNQAGILANIRRMIDLHIFAKNYIVAKELCDECMELSEKQKVLRSQERCHYLMSIIYGHLEKYNKARDQARLALSFTTKREDESRLPIYLSTLAKAELALGNYTEAENLFKEALTKASDSRKKGQVTNIQLDYATLLLERNKFTQLKDLLKEIEQNLTTYKLSAYKKIFLELQIDLSKRLNDKESIISYQEQLIDYQNENEKSNLSKSNIQPNAIYSLFKANNEKSNLLANQSRLEKISQYRYRWLIGSGIFVLLLSLLAWTVWVFQKQKRKLLKQENNQKILELKASMNKKELVALRAQMNPHFLFNSLTSINNYVMHEEPRLASRYLTKFSHLMRKVLNNSEKNLITLDEELATLRLYTEMENIRFDNRFDISFHVKKEVNTLNTYIPTMILQPFVENAIHHGLNHKSGSGTLVVDIEKQHNTVLVTITDDGIGRVAAQSIKDKKEVKNKSMGMKITSDRIALIKELYNIDTKVEVHDRVDDKGRAAGTVVMLTLPFIHEENISNYESQ